MAEHRQIDRNYVICMMWRDGTATSLDPSLLQGWAFLSCCTVPRHSSCSALTVLKWSWNWEVPVVLPKWLFGEKVKLTDRERASFRYPPRSSAMRAKSGAAQAGPKLQILHDGAHFHHKAIPMRRQPTRMSMFHGELTEEPLRQYVGQITYRSFLWLTVISIGYLEDKSTYLTFLILVECFRA